MTDETPTTETKLDMQRVQRWAELLDGDPQAREFMRTHIAGSELTQLSELALRSQRLELALKHGIPAQLAEVHLTASDPELLEQQAESLAALLKGQLTKGEGQETNADGNPTQFNRPSSLEHRPSLSPLPVYEAAPVNRDEWLEQQFVRMYEH